MLLPAVYSAHKVLLSRNALCVDNFSMVVLLGNACTKGPLSTLRVCYGLRIFVSLSIVAMEVRQI